MTVHVILRAGKPWIHDGHPCCTPVMGQSVSLHHDCMVEMTPVNFQKRAWKDSWDVDTQFTLQFSDVFICFPQSCHIFLGHLHELSSNQEVSTIAVYNQYHN